MKRLLILPLLALFFSCSKKTTDECPPVMCTMEFRSLSITFKDKSNNPVSVADFTAVNRRTGEFFHTQYPPSVNAMTYTIVTDADRKVLSTTGDTIDVSGTNLLTTQKKTASLVVAGGKCSCHIQKVSGPEEVVFD